MSAIINALRFLAHSIGITAVLVGFGPVILISWLCYFACKEAEEEPASDVMPAQENPSLEWQFQASCLSCCRLPVFRSHEYSI